MKISMIIVFFFVLPFAFAQLQVGFYGASCPKAESIVKQVVQKKFIRDESITAALLRMHFHDCFVRGCDASILIVSTPGNEKEADANQSVRGLDLIDEIKEGLEAECPSTVSCADIITMATRDAVALSGGPKYDIPTGRRDGLVSNKSDVHLRGPDITISDATQLFVAKGMTTEEMVTLLGAHTVGIAHCHFFQDTLSSSNNGKINPNMDPALDAQLVKLCSNITGGGDEPATFLDQRTSFLVDNAFYKEILQRRGILEIDQQLAVDSSTKGFVLSFALNDAKFQKSFADALIKMGKIEVLVGNDGEIRKNCSAFNNRN